MSVLTFAFSMLSGQDIESIGKDDPLTISGGLSANQIFYTASGINSRRDPYSYFLTGNLNMSLYGWSDGQMSSVANNLPSGNYFATVTDGFGCNTIKPVTINSPDAIVVSYIISQPDCAGDCNGAIATSVVGGTQPYNYEWTTLSASTASVSGLCAGSYNLIVRDFNSCIVEESVMLSEPEPLSIFTNAIDPTCLGRCDGIAEVTGNGGTGPYQFQWLNGPTTSIYADICSGEYAVTVSDSNGCSAESTATILDGEPLSADLGGEATLCVGQSKTFDIGTNWFSIEWTSTTGFVSAIPVVSISDPGLYYLKAIDGLGCIALDTFKLETSLDLWQSLSCHQK